VFSPALAYRKTAFVVASGTLKKGAPGKGAANLALFLADPDFHYDSGVSALRVRILNGATEILAKDFTTLGHGTTRELKAARDPATTNTLSRFVFIIPRGAMSLKLSRLDLTAVPSSEAHLGVELTIGDRIYYTAVTFFERRAGSFTTLGR
jgi:hypothetical protein